MPARRSPNGTPREVQDNPAVRAAYLGERCMRARRARAAHRGRRQRTARSRPARSRLRRRAGAEGHRPARERGRTRRGARRERRRQVHADARDLRPASSGRGGIAFEGRDLGALRAHRVVGQRRGARARGPAGISRILGAATTSCLGALSAQTGGAMPRSKRCSTAFRACASGCSSAPACCRAASSRCWPSRAV